MTYLYYPFYIGVDTCTHVSEKAEFNILSNGLFMQAECSKYFMDLCLHFGKYTCNLNKLEITWVEFILFTKYISLFLT